jgi:hypothetical protein
MFNFVARSVVGASLSHSQGNHYLAVRVPTAARGSHLSQTPRIPAETTPGHKEIRVTYLLSYANNLLGISLYISIFLGNFQYGQSTQSTL